jgi:hypothetical protein
MTDQEKQEYQRERNRRKSKAYRARHPERARESRQRCDNKRRQGTDWRPKHTRKAYAPGPKKPRLSEWAQDVKARFLAWKRGA